MYDRPDLKELIEAARLHLEANVVPAVREDPKLYFQTLVAINVLKIAGREIELAPGHIAAEWASLNALESVDTSLPDDLRTTQSALENRNRALCAAIRRGDYDAAEAKTALFAHVSATTAHALEVANPRLLKKLNEEAAQG